MKHKLKNITDNPNCVVTSIAYKETLDKSGVVFDVSMYLPYTIAEPINELENPCKELYLINFQTCKLTEPMNTKLITQTHFIDAIKEGCNYIVGSVDSIGCISFAQNPAMHSSASLARAECKRLAKFTPGKLYLFVKLAGAEMVPANTLSI